MGEHKFKLSENFISKYKRKKAPFGFNGLGELVYMRTYSRIKENGKNENLIPCPLLLGQRAAHPPDPPLLCGFDLNGSDSSSLLPHIGKRQGMVKVKEKIN